MHRRHWHVIADVLRDRPHSVGAEVGVFRGIFAKQLLNMLPDIAKYYCIDPWEHYDEYLLSIVPSSMERKIKPPQAFNVFKRNTKAFQDKVIVLRKMSQDALIDIPDESLDFVFLDGNHTYEHAIVDIPNWSKKVKVGGIISGHDYHDNKRGRRIKPFGVKQAVRELVSDYRVEVNTWYTEKKASK